MCTNSLSRLLRTGSKRGRLYATPTAADAIGTTGGGQRRSLRNDAGGQINPDWEEWLMGWPVGWTALKPLPKSAIDDWLTGLSDETWWNIDPHTTGEINRTARTADVPDRRERVRVIGQGQVPACAARAWQVLTDVI
jgi:hypothetical protein